MKSSSIRNSPVNFYYWRNNHKKEIDLIIESSKMHAIELKSGKTLRSDFFDTLNFWQNLSTTPRKHCVLVYGGDKDDLYSGMKVIAWNRIDQFFSELAEV